MYDRKEKLVERVQELTESWNMACALNDWMTGTVSSPKKL